jgi:HEPN domain-containing protein
MRPPDEVRREFVQQWIDKAEGDLAAARRLLVDEFPHRFHTAFHAQQAAEKFIKAFLVHHQIEFTKTHSFQPLLESVARVDPPLADALSEALALNPFAVEIRYPDEEPEPTPEEARRAVEIAGHVRDTILPLLQD